LAGSWQVAAAAAAGCCCASLQLIQRVLLLLCLMMLRPGLTAVLLDKVKHLQQGKTHECLEAQGKLTVHQRVGHD
jgi:hypothetical protein